MCIKLKKKRIINRILSVLLFISVFMTSIMFQTIPVKAGYLAYPIGEKGSFIAVYDNTTKEVSKAFDDVRGEFYYMNNRFYM